MNAIEENRIGTFDIPDDGLHDLERVYAIMGNMFVMRCEYVYCKRAFEYYAFSPLFKSVEAGEEPPKYYIKTDKQEDGIIITASKDMFCGVKTFDVNSEENGNGT